MTTPRTPQRSRLAPDSPTPSSVRSPSPSRPPQAVSRVQRPGASASPQIKAALAALRKSRQNSTTPSLNSSTPESASLSPDPFSTPPRAVPSDAAVDVAKSREQSPEAGSSHDEDYGWAKKNEHRLIEAAKKTGLLNFASQGLDKLPQTVYTALLPRSSPYHPSRRNRSTYRQEPKPTYSFTGDENETAWFEQCDLKSLNLANNELKAVDEEVGGFEDLEFLDLHGNLLTSVPPSFGYLVHLTSLNLASNSIKRFPTQIVNLRFLKDLDLSHNQLENLWTSDWETELAGVLKPPETSPSATPESPERIRDFFADSSFKRSQPELSTASTCPFPLLQTLKLSGNAFEASTFGSEGFELPPRLKTLDLSSSQLVDSSLPPLLFGSLKDLVELDLSNNGLTEDVFSPHIFPLERSDRLFPALRTLELSLNPIDDLESLEEFLTENVSRPIEYVGLAKVVSNLVKSEEQRLRGGKRIGLKLKGEGDGEAESVGFELEVSVRECMLRGEQERRRAKFPTRDGAGPKAAPTATVLEVPPTNRSTSASPSSSPPRSRPLSPSASTSNQQVPEVLTTPSRKQVILEPWEIEAAAGLSTPAGRRKAAAQAARERAERQKLEEEEKRRVKEERQRTREAEAEKRRAQEAAELERRMEKTTLEDSAEEQAFQSEASSSPPPYSPRTSTVSEPCPSHNAQVATAAPPGPVAASTDPALVTISSAFNRTTRTVNLASRSLASLPSLTTGSPPSSAPDPTTLDLSRNAFTRVPLVSIESWNWSTKLRTLTITHNRISSLLENDIVNSPISLPSLTALDLSHNHLTSSSSTTPLLAQIDSLFPALRSLCLAYNRLSSLDGIEPLLLGGGAGDRGTRPSQLKTLALNGNKIADITALCRVAERIGVIGPEGSDQWALEELDLSDNEIARLQPTLGLLPHSLILAVSGNTFRFPKREIWERPGARLLLPNLRERLG
ncbi:hypothetical protein JCM11491_005322 [Sporobolomyces phaffii]